MPTDAPSNYMSVGDEFRIGTARWWGRVIIGADAIYLFQRVPARAGKYLVPFELLADRLLPSRTLPARPYTEIPDSVRSDPQWPVAEFADRAVLIVPKSEVAFLYHESGRLETRFIFSGVEIAIPHGRFGAKRVRTFVEAARWPLFWDGVPVNLPTRSRQQLLGDIKALSFGRPYISYPAIAVSLILFGWIALRRGL